MEDFKLIEDKKKAEWKATDETMVMGFTKEIHSTQVFHVSDSSLFDGGTKFTKKYVTPGKELTLETIPESSYGLSVIMRLSFISKDEKNTIIKKHLTLNGSKLIMPFAYSKAESAQPDALEYLKEKVESWYQNENKNKGENPVAKK